MRILKLKISGYKNLDVDLDLSNTSNYVSFIGVNGSGKSNILEAISYIFANLHSPRRFAINFSYNITYEIRQYEVNVIDRVVRLTKESGDLRNRIIGSNISNYLPDEIIACYSGDELRLWTDVYSTFYFSYISKIKKGATQEKHKLVYINKYVWEIALVTLLCHDNSKEYIKNLLNVSNISDVEIRFNFPANYDTRRKNYVKITETGTEAQNDALNLIRIIKESQGNSFLTFDNIQDIIFISNPDNTKKVRKLFFLLHAVGSDKDKKLFEKINVSFNGITLRELSEGEKKLILIKCITDVIANENSLCLFDEPDSHIHISRKNELIRLIDNPNRCSLVTTHSSILANKMKFKNLIFLNNGKLENADKICQINKLTGGEINYIEGAFIATSKKIVIVEGTYDIKYIRKAIQIFGIRDSKYYKLDELSFIPQGSAGNTKSFFDDVVKALHLNANKILYIYDFDKPGRDGATAIMKFKEEYPKLDYVFYQEDYTKEYEKGVENDFFIEDMFAKESYGSIVADIHAKCKFREFKSNNQGATHDRIKKHIETNYLSSFSDDYFNGFVPLLEVLINRFNLL
ncbi:AAA family ATPase [Paludibacter sp.]|uniref:ATP-dependent nuclease n=1 Tax=Paludibacter sp. TaxID=1898105 RepID=UPI0013560BCA|nr:AAA family ATPase [Paludibacter sp.]MTK53116.1 AAA family ATPase [Paludibacter sp.]